MAKKEPSGLIEMEGAYKVPELAMSGEVKIKVIHMAIGLDLIGSKTSVDNRRATMTLQPWGVLCVSKETGKTIGIPWANVKGFEILK